LTKSRLIFILGLVFTALTLIFCQKKLFGWVEVHGQVVNYFTKEPISVDITLNADDVHSASSFAPESIILEKTTSKSDGTFSIKSKQSKVPNYYLHVDKTHFFDPVTKESKIDLKKKNKKDMGIIFAGTHEFTCKVSIVSTSGKCLWFYDRQNNKYTYFNSGTNTDIVYKQKISAGAFEDLQHNFLVECRIDFCEPNMNPVFSNTSFSVPITSADTLNFTINY
jgi:hypothetical protein